MKESLAKNFIRLRLESGSLRKRSHARKSFFPAWDFLARNNSPLYRDGGGERISPLSALHSFPEDIVPYTHGRGASFFCRGRCPQRPATAAFSFVQGVGTPICTTCGARRNAVSQEVLCQAFLQESGFLSRKQVKKAGGGRPDGPAERPAPPGNG